MNASIPEKIADVRHRIAAAAKKYGRPEDAVRLLAVSKTHGPELLREAWEGGQREFGENYLQEALDKMEALADLAPCWHFIGPIQSNKTRDIAGHFDWVHSVERLKIATRLSEQRPAELPPLKVLLQVNLDGEQSKAGVSLDALPGLAGQVALLPRLALSGLMAIPSPDKTVSEQRAGFALLAMARDQLLAAGHEQCRELSMGMSADFEAAIAEGATIVRIGTDIFGQRP